MNNNITNVNNTNVVLEIEEQPSNYYIVNPETNIIENVVVATPSIAKEMNLYPVYDGAWIGDEYNPPKVEEPITIEPDEDTLEYMSNALNEGIEQV